MGGIHTIAHTKSFQITVIRFISIEQFSTSNGIIAKLNEIIEQPKTIINLGNALDVDLWMDVICQPHAFSLKSKMHLKWQSVPISFDLRSEFYDGYVAGTKQMTDLPTKENRRHKS